MGRCACCCRRWRPGALLFPVRIGSPSSSTHEPLTLALSHHFAPSPSQINVLGLPSLNELAPGQPFAPSPVLTLRTPSAKPVDSLSFHPLASSLFLATSATSLSVFDASVGAGTSTAAYEVEMPVQAWCAAWSADGRLVSAGGKDGKLRLWDVRQGGQAVFVRLYLAALSSRPHRSPDE